MAKEIRCPACGNTDVAKLRYLEDIVAIRDVGDFDAEGALRISDYYYSTEGYDEGSNPRFECRADVEKNGHRNLCLHEFPIPEDLSIDFGLDE